MNRQTLLLFGISVFWLALSLLFDGVNTLVLPNRLLGFAVEGNQATVLGFLTFFGLLSGMLLQPVAGMVSDRFYPTTGRRGLIGLGVAACLGALAVFATAQGLLLLGLSYLGLQLAASTAQAAQQGFIPDLVPPERRGLASGLKGFMDLGGAMLGFIVLGQLLGAGQPDAAIFVMGAVLVVAFLLTLLFVKERSGIERKSRLPGPARVALLDAFHLDFRRYRDFAWLVLSRFLFLLGTYAVGRFLLFFVADRLGLNPDDAAEQAGTLLAGLALINILVALPAGAAADRFGRTQVMAVGAFLSAAGALLLISASSMNLIFAFGALMALGSACFSGANWAMTADLSPKDQSARFMGLANFGTAGAAACAGLFGPMVDAANATAAGAGYTLLFLASTSAFLASLLVLRRVRVESLLAANE